MVIPEKMLIEKTYLGEKKVLALSVVALILASALVFDFRYLSTTNFLVGLMLLPFAMTPIGARRNNWTMMVLVLLFSALAYTFHVRAFYYFSVMFFLIWIMELTLGRLSPVVFFLIVFMSPVFVQVVTILGFPIRLALTSISGQLLHAIGLDVQVAGNVIVLGNDSFAVEEACMGLHMLAFSMLMAVFILAFHMRTRKLSVNLLPMAGYFLMAFCLNLGTNITRILILVFFRIGSTDPMHEIVGMVCLVVYVMVPLHLTSGLFLRRFGKPVSPVDSGVPLTRISVAMVLAMCVVHLVVAWRVSEARSEEVSQFINVQFDGHPGEPLVDGIRKFTERDVLVYVKPIPEFFSGEHTPLMCWKGTGYAFSKIENKEVAGLQLYIGTLQKDASTLYTAWWYDNGHVKTIVQSDWRFRMMKGESRFALVNVTSSSQQRLLDTVQSILANNRLTIKN